jgi:hypothetical protein
VKLTKHGIVPYEWDSEAKDYKPMLKGSTALLHLRSRCVLDDGLSLGDLFNAVDDDPLLLQVIGSYSWCGPIHEFHKQARLPQPPPKEDDEEPLVAVVIEPFAELHRNYENKEAPDTFEGVYMHFSGLGSKGTSYSISCTPMNQLAHLPVQISTSIRFSKNFEKMFDAEYHPSLLEVLDAVYWDISFHGGPQENAEFIEGLDRMMDDIENGRVKTIPLALDDLLKDDEEAD